MSDKEIPNSNNVIIYAKPGQVLDANSAQVDGSVFEWNGKGAGLSANWLEYFISLPKDEQIAKIRCLIHYDMRPTGGLAELNVGTVLKWLTEELDDPRFLHRPSPPDPPKHPKPDPTHCELSGMPLRDDRIRAAKIGEMIAECVEAVHKTKSPAPG